MCPPCGRRRNISCQDIPQIYLHVLHEFEEGNGNLLQSSCLENPRGGGAWWAAVHGVARSRTRLGDFTFTFHFHALKKEMATHSNDLAWKIPGMGEPGGLPSMGLHRVGHDWSDLAAAAAAASWVIRLFLDPLPITDTEALWIGTKVNLKILQFGWWDRIGNPEIGPIHICPVDFWQRCRRSSMEVRSSFVWFSVNCSRTIGHPQAKNNGPPISYKS